MASAAFDLTELEKDPRLFLYTSLTAGSSHIITATSRMETILKANRIPFQAIDIATDEKARRLWQRRGAKKKLPGLVKDGYVLGDLEEIEEWNEFGELKENIGPVPASNAAPAGGRVGVNIAATLPGVPSTTKSGTLQQPVPKGDAPRGIALPGAAEIAAIAKAKAEAAAAEKKKVSVIDEPAKPETSSTNAAEKKDSIATAKEIAKSHPNLDHLSAPASRIQSGNATPDQAPELTRVKSPIEEDAIKAIGDTSPRTIEALVDRPGIYSPTEKVEKPEFDIPKEEIIKLDETSPKIAMGEAQTFSLTKADGKDESASAKPVEKIELDDAAIPVEDEPPIPTTSNVAKDDAAQRENVVESSSKDIQTNEKPASIPTKDDSAESEQLDDNTKGIENLKVTDAARGETQSQPAKSEADATKSVED